MAAERNTIQKNIVLKTVMGMKNHPTAQTVYEEIKKDYSSISRATVFRVLKQLSDQGVIYRVVTSEGADHYDFKTENHYHIRCRNCGKVVDVDMPYIDGLADRIKDAEGYIITGYNISFDGLCPQCSSKS